MIPAISKTLAKVLAIETSLSGIDQVNFDPPSQALTGKTALNIYCYNYCYSEKKPSYQGANLAFMISAWDTPAWGSQPLLAEALSSLQRHRQIAGKFLEPELEAYRSLLIKVDSVPAIEPVVLWETLGLPMRPALYVTVKLPA
jgi:hypothetical protein